MSKVIRLKHKKSRNFDHFFDAQIYCVFHFFPSSIPCKVADLSGTAVLHTVQVGFGLDTSFMKFQKLLEKLKQFLASKKKLKMRDRSKNAL